MHGTLCHLEQQMQSVDLSQCPSTALLDLSDQIHAAKRSLDGQLNKVLRESRRREKAGKGTPASTVARGSGSTSQEEGDALAARAAMSDELPAVGDSVDSGVGRDENTRLVAARTKRLTPAQRKKLAEMDTVIARRAETYQHREFARWFNGVIRELTKPADDGLTLGERDRAKSFVNFKLGPDGMWHLTGLFDDEQARQINNILNTYAKTFNEGRTPDGAITGNTRAAALHQLLTRPGKHDGFEPSARMGVGYIVDVETLVDGPHDGSVAETWDGQDIYVCPSGTPSFGGAETREVSEANDCDTDLYAIAINKAGQPKAVGRTRRSATREQRLALRALYPTCPLDGETPFAACEIHHVNVFYENGGETELPNLVPTSRAWHHRIHDQGWKLKLHPDRSLTLWRPDGTQEQHHPPPTPITRRHRAIPTPESRAEH